MRFWQKIINVSTWGYEENREEYSKIISLLGFLLPRQIKHTGIKEVVMHMGKYLILWEVDQNRMPISPQERGAGWAPMIDMIKEDLKKGVIKDWGAFVGEMRGYGIMEGTELEVSNNLQQYVPWIIFKVHDVMSVEQTEEMAKALTK